MPCEHAHASRGSGRSLVLLLGALFLSAGCGGDGTSERIACPELGAGYASLVYPIDTIELDAATKGSFAGGWFVGYSFVAPPGTTITATLTGARAEAGAMLMLYGPRVETGQFGLCQVVSDTATSGETSLLATVSAAAAGELLLVVANQNPMSAAGTSFQVTLTCEGECDVAPACPEPLAPTCDITYCPQGFATDADGCPVCACKGSDASCPPGHVVLAGQCVDPCKANAERDPVCGSDGNTYDNTQAAQCAGVTDVKPGACEDLCADTPAFAGGAFECEHKCTSYSVDPDTYCKACECADVAQCASCPATWRPVCGSDGVTYLNPCLLACGGAKSAYPGFCLPDCPFPDASCQSVGKFGYAGEGLCPKCAFGAGSYPGSQAAQEEGACAALCAKGGGDEPCTSVVVRTFVSLEDAKKAGVGATTGVCPSHICSKAEDCGSSTKESAYGCKIFGEAKLGYCTHVTGIGCKPGPADGCGPQKECKGVGSVSVCVSKCLCPTLYDPVCAVLGGKQKTYDNSCEAACAGARMVTPGECCKAKKVTGCNPDEVPALDVSGCRTGECAPKAPCDDACTTGAQCVQVLDDAAEFDNACVAHCNGQQIDVLHLECSGP